MHSIGATGRSLRSESRQTSCIRKQAQGRRIQGVDAYVELCQGWKQVFADGRGTVHNTVASGGTVAQEVTWEGTHTGPLVGPGGTLAPTGRRAPVPEQCGT